MNIRLTRLGIVLVVIGVAFAAAGAFVYIKTQEGYKSLSAFSAAQNVQLSYNEDGQLGRPRRNRGRRRHHVPAER